MMNPPPDRDPNDKQRAHGALPHRDPIRLADATTATLQDRLDSITNAWREGDIALVQTLAQQLASSASDHGNAIVKRSSEELGALAMHDEADASMITEKIEQLIRLCRRSA
jgi:hypothetical protein